MIRLTLNNPHGILPLVHVQVATNNILIPNYVSSKVSQNLGTWYREPAAKPINGNSHVVPAPQKNCEKKEHLPKYQTQKWSSSYNRQKQ